MIVIQQYIPPIYNNSTPLTLSPPIPLRLYILLYWSNPPFSIFDIWGALALSPERQSAQMSKIENGGLDQYGAEFFEQQQFGPAGVERV